MLKKSELFEVNKQLKRTGVLKSALMANDENKPLGRRNKWTKEAYLELEEAEKEEREILHFS